MNITGIRNNTLNPNLYANKDKSTTTKADVSKSSFVGSTFIKGNTEPYIGSILDKGTAANTTIYLDKSSFNQIVNYTTNNPDCKWEELGCDGQKRWVVVNGQRFEYPLSEEEKKAYELKHPLLEALKESDEEKEKLKNLLDSQTKFDVDLNNGDLTNIGHEKIENLMKNDKVMNMLNDIFGSTKLTMIGL